MRNLIKKIAFVLSLMIAVTTIDPAISSKASIQANSSNVFLNFVPTATGAYTSKITTLIATDKVAKYLVEENNVKYTLEYDLANDTVKVNNNSYSLSDYLHAVGEEATTLNSGVVSHKTVVEILNSSYTPISSVMNSTASDTTDSLNTDLTSEVSDAVNMIIPSETSEESDATTNTLTGTSSNELNSLTPPTTGYGTEFYAGTYKKIQVKIGLVTTALTVIAAFVFRGSVTIARAFVTKVLKDAVSAGLIASTASTITGDQYYDKYQAHHKTVRATRERRRPYTLIQGRKFYGSDYTFYFYNSRPI